MGKGHGPIQIREPAYASAVPVRDSAAKTSAVNREPNLMPHEICTESVYTNEVFRNNSNKKLSDHEEKTNNIHILLS